GVLRVERVPVVHRADRRFFDVVRRGQVRLAEIETQDAVHSHGDFSQLPNSRARNVLHRGGDVGHKGILQRRGGQGPAPRYNVPSMRFPIAAITDEFSPDIETAVRSMAEIGMTGAELRMVFGKNILDLT